jgi:hypothetical protein
MPLSDGCDIFVGIGGPGGGFGLQIVLVEKSVDGGLKIDDRFEDTSLQPSLGQGCEEPLDGIEPRARGWREMEDEPLVSREALDHLGVLVGGVVVEDHVYHFTSGNLWRSGSG